MTEPLDLAALRRYWMGSTDEEGRQVEALIAELEATRAERDAAKWDFLAALADRKDETARAERAEAYNATALAEASAAITRAEKAEAALKEMTESERAS